MLTPPGAIPPAATDPLADGAFRLLCNWSKMAFDDPIVYPGQPGVSHHHTFFGNTGIDATTTSDNIRSKGMASCRGGTINLSGYWMPSMIDTATNKPVAPNSLLVYYKTGLWTYMNDGSVIQPLPEGPEDDRRHFFERNCRRRGRQLRSASCRRPERRGLAPSDLPFPQLASQETVCACTSTFPQCWDGINLDSPDHKSHMSVPELFWSGDPERQYRCPRSHPVVLPLITFNFDFDVVDTAATANWRLASDTYDRSAPGGYSMHADWMNGWDPAVSDLWGIELPARAPQLRLCESWGWTDPRRVPRTTERWCDVVNHVHKVFDPCSRGGMRLRSVIRARRRRAAEARPRHVRKPWPRHGIARRPRLDRVDAAWPS